MAAIKQSPGAPPEPPPSVSATELRRRLLANAPPAIEGSTIATHGLESEVKSGSGPVPHDVLLRKLKMPAYVAPPQDSISVSSRTPINVTALLKNSLHAEPPIGESPSQELVRLRVENRELRHLLVEMKTLLQEASDTEQGYARSSQETDLLITEQKAQIEQLQNQLEQIENQISSGELAPAAPTGPPKTKTELEEWADELEKEASSLNQERRGLDEERKQLHEDESSLEKQMRDMEVGMARERAMMARQEIELKRLSAEIQHELELMQRGDASLREQMVKFQRRAQEVMGAGRSSSTTPIVKR